MKLEVGLNVISSYKRLAYSAWHAIAEFIDNSTQSYFNHKEELDSMLSSEGERFTVSVTYDKDSGVLRISDNALGMNYSELEQALRVGHPPANTSGRSKYGLGLKTAACWLGNLWTIRTKKAGDTNEYVVTIDVEKVASGLSELQCDVIKGKAAPKHYTVIEIKNLNREFHARTQGKIKNYLRSMYREDLRTELLVLEWQGTKLIWESIDDNLLKAKDQTKYKKNFDFLANGKSVSGWVGILESGSRSQAGFSILHKGRVIKGWPESWRPESLYGQMQGSNDLVNQRLVGEINLDDFDVSHTKDDILWIGNEEDLVQEGLLKHCGDYKEVAKEFRKRQDDQRKPSEVETATALDEFKKELQSPEIVDKISILPIPPDSAVSSAIQTIKEKVIENYPETIKANVGSLSIRIYILSDMSPNDPYVTVDSTQASEVVVIINMAHPHISYLVGSEGVLNYFRHCTYDAIAEWQARAKAGTLNPNTIKLLKDGLLRIPFEMEQHSAHEDMGTTGVS